MDNSISQMSTEDVRDANESKSPIRGSPLAGQESDLEWSTASSHLEQVQYVEEPSQEYERVTFTGFEAGAPFSPHQPPPLDFDEHRVSPLDPNMSSAARYSPVYSISNSSARPHSPSQPLPSPNSPFQNAVLPNPDSPINPSGSQMPSSPSSVYAPPSASATIGGIPSEDGELSSDLTSTSHSLPALPTSIELIHSPPSSMIVSDHKSAYNPKSSPVISEDNTCHQSHRGGNTISSQNVNASLREVSPHAREHHENKRVLEEDSTGGILISDAHIDSNGKIIVTADTLQYHNVKTILSPPGKANGVVSRERITVPGMDIESVELIICNNNEACLTDLVVRQETNDLSVVVQREVHEIEGHGGDGGSQPFHPMVVPSSGHGVIMHPPAVVPSTFGTLKTSSLGGMASSNLDTPCAANAPPKRPSQGNLRKNHCVFDDAIIADELDAGCEDCDFSYGKECFHHRIQSISDKPVPSRAWATLPATYLTITKVAADSGGGKDYGVFARKTIPKRTQFGPVEGIMVDSKYAADVTCQKLKLLIESEHGEMINLDVSNENLSNWMRFVRPAKSFKELNLVLSQQGHSLYFTTTRLIHPRQELQVWYSLPYAQRRSLPVLLPSHQEKKLVEDAENSWPCFECNSRFLSSDELQRHLNEHENEKSDDGSSSKTRLKRPNASLRRKSMVNYPLKKYKSVTENNKEKSSPGAEYKCQTCSRTFPRNYSLKRHLLLHTGEKKYPCSICGHEFSHPYNRDRHFRKHHKKVEDGQLNGKNFSGHFSKRAGGSSSEWLCTHCSLTFDSPSVLNLHTLAHAAENLEGDVETEFREDQEEKCATIEVLAYNCSNSYDGKTAAAFNGNNLCCPQCTKEFPTKKELIVHASVHGKMRRSRGSINPAKPHKCELCYKSFASEDRLQRHMLVHGAEESKPLQCEVCYKRFLNNSALACHIKVHTDEKTFECPICREVFCQVISLKDHVYIHCDEGVFTCPHCNKVFDEYSLIRKHIRAFHSERKHKCSFCGKLFPTMDKLKTHMLRHSDHREFLCANCGKQFKRKDKLKEHMKRMHSGERETAEKESKKKFIPKVSPTDYQRFIYKCHTCLVGFKRRGMLVNHLAKRHPDISPETVPELNLPILKTTRDYYCQYCEKIYKSSSKRKAHILKNHPGAELPMSNRRKGGLPEMLGFPNPTYSQTVGSITTNPHGCAWCHKQYASKPKLLQHQRKKHLDLLPQAQQVPRNIRIDSVDSPDSAIEGKFLTGHEETHVIHLQDSDAIASEVSIVSAEFVTPAAEKPREYQDTEIIIDASSLKQSLKATPEDNGIASADLLVQAMSELTQNPAEYRLFSGSEHYFKIIHAAPTHIMVAATESLPPSPCPSPVVAASSLPSPETRVGTLPNSTLHSNSSTSSAHPPSTPDAADSSCSSSSSISSLTSSSSTMTSNSSPVTTFLTPVSVSVSSSLSIEPSQLQHILTCSPTYATTTLPATSVSPSPNVLPRTWAATYTSYTAR